jgi:hypothetical protein
MISPENHEKAIAHYAAVLMYHDTGDGAFATSARLFAKFYYKLVPEKGQASSIQGEILRAVGVLSTEDRRNGCVNWDKNSAEYEQLVEFLRESLAKAEVFEPIQRDRILEDLDAVIAEGHEGIAAEVIRLVFGRLIGDAVAYCRAHPKLVANEM